MANIVEHTKARRTKGGPASRRPWVRPVLESAAIDETQKAPKFGAGTDAVNSLS